MWTIRTTTIATDAVDAWGLEGMILPGETPAPAEPYADG